MAAYRGRSTWSLSVMNVGCSTCHTDNEFSQPHAYHAGFGNQGFLYDDAGTLTLVWSSFDPAYVALMGSHHHPWELSDTQRELLERALLPAPSGGKWGFYNPARCVHCTAIIGLPLIASNIYYFVYPGSVVLDDGGESLRSVLRVDA